MGMKWTAMKKRAAPAGASRDDPEVVWTLPDDPEEERPRWPDDPGAREQASRR